MPRRPAIDIYPTGYREEGSVTPKSTCDPQPGVVLVAQRGQPGVELGSDGDQPCRPFGDDYPFRGQRGPA